MRISRQVFYFLFVGVCIRHINETPKSAAINSNERRKQFICLRRFRFLLFVLSIFFIAYAYLHVYKRLPPHAYKALECLGDFFSTYLNKTRHSSRIFADSFNVLEGDVKITVVLLEDIKAAA